MTKRRKSVRPVNEQTLADQRARMLLSGVTSEQILADARRRALETGVFTA